MHVARPLPVLSLSLLLAACQAADGPNERGFQVADTPPNGALDSVQQAARVCADGPTVDGIDVSHYQGAINWDAVAGSSVKFAITRIGDGLGEDETFDGNWAGIRNAGLIRGAYQFFRTLRDPEEMAAIVVRKVGRLGPGDLPVVLDLEGASIQDQGPDVVQDHARRWLQAVEAGTGKRPIIYTGFYVWRDQMGNPNWPEYPLWIAAYVLPRCPDIPDGWNRWTMWQTTSSGDIPGIAGNVDTDVFNGDLGGLQDLANGGGVAYGARFVAQSFPYAADPPVAMTVGQSVDGWFDMRNTGTETWGPNTRFAPTPRDGTGPFGPEGWLDANRISACPQATPPGEVCRFPVHLTAHTPGETTQYFGMVEEGHAWFSDPGQGGPPDDQLAIRVSVSPAPVQPDMAVAPPTEPPTNPPAPDMGDSPPTTPPTPDLDAGDTDARPDADGTGTDDDLGRIPDGDVSASDSALGPAVRPDGANSLQSERGARYQGGCQAAPGLGGLAGLPFLTFAWVVRRRRPGRDTATA